MSLSGSDLSVELNDANVISDTFYEVTVDAQTEVGFNDSLHLQSIILPSKATGTDALLYSVTSSCEITNLM